MTFSILAVGFHFIGKILDFIGLIFIEILAPMIGVTLK